MSCRSPYRIGTEGEPGAAVGQRDVNGALEYVLNVAVVNDGC